jgi:Family of unknown function (DUF5923)
MDKATSVLAALDSAKLPSTQQLINFIDWLNNLAFSSLENANLTSQGRILAHRLREILEAYKRLISNKNADNLLQEAIWHLTEGDCKPTVAVPEASATADIQSIRTALRALLSIVWSSISSESSSLLTDFASFTRLSLADAAELFEAGASLAKKNLREIERGVQKGKRMPITGRSKDRVMEEQADVKLKWEHGMDTVKGVGDTVIDATRSTAATVKEKADTTKTRIYDAFLRVFLSLFYSSPSDISFKLCDRTQSDPKYRDAITTIVTIFQTRLTQSLNTASSAQEFSLASFINDPTPEQHISKALRIFQTLLERVAGIPLDPVFKTAQACIAAIGKDSDLRAWFDNFFDFAKANLMKEGYARSDASKENWEALCTRWNSLMEKDSKWKRAVEECKAALRKVVDGLKEDEDLARVRAAHARFAEDLERGLVDAGREAETGLEALVERATWFWQDLFKMYLPRFVSKLQSLPIPRCISFPFPTKL